MNVTVWLINHMAVLFKETAKGAAIGATAGGFGGGIKEGFGAENRYKRAYTNCLRHRGHYALE